jgi:transposase-like protein
VVGTVGRTSGQVRLRVLRRTDGERLCPHVHGYTFEEATVYTDGWKGYSQVERDRLAVCHGDGEWARDEDGDGIREVHVNTIEGPQATLRNFLRSFRGVHKKHLAGYVAICEFAINLKRITPAFISALARVHDF